MIVAGHQPQYLPFAGFFNKAILADKFVFVDHVQFEKKGWQNRNRIKSQMGWQWLTVPVLTAGRFDQPISEVEIDNTKDWAKTHWRTLTTQYGKSPHFKEHASFFEETYLYPWKRLVDLNISIISYLMGEFKIQRPLYFSSAFGLTGKKTDLLTDICEALHCDTYLSGSGPGAKQYVETDKFKAKHLSHVFQKFTPPDYGQNKCSVANLSVIDMLFNVGSEKSRKLLDGAGKICQ